MQGELNEIDIRSILQLIELGQRTGELFVEAYSSSMGKNEGSIQPRQDSGFLHSTTNRSWFVFFLNGQIIYATDTKANLNRLRDYLHRYKVDAALDNIEVSAIATTNAPEYGYLWTLLENHTLTPAQSRSIIQSMIHETLFDLFSIHQGTFIFEIGSALSPQLTTLEIGSITPRIVKQVQEWRQFYPHIESPEQCVVISDAEQLRESLPENLFQNLDRWVDGQTSIRQLARYLNRDILVVARAIYPYVQQGLIQLLDYPAQSSRGSGSPKASRKRELEVWEETRAPRVVCIDDGITICQAVECILSQHGYEVQGITDPLEALGLVFKLKPDLILCDIAMPNLDGYEICAMLRQSTLFRQIPIVMLTGKDGFIDRVRARMIGATDYLTKPFGESELIMLVEKYIGSGKLSSEPGGSSPAGTETDNPEMATSASLPSTL